MLSSYEVYEGVLAFLIGAGIFSCLSMAIDKIQEMNLPLAGLAGGCAAVVCTVKWGVGWRALVVLAFLYLLTVIAYTDMKTMKISNRLVIAAAAVSIASVRVFPEVTLGQRLVGVLCVSAVLLIIALIIPGGIGGGDIKLMAVCGLFLGWENTVKAFVAAMLAAGIYCVGMMLAGRIDLKSRIALGPFLCLGMAAVIAAIPS